MSESERRAHELRTEAATLYLADATRALAIAKRAVRLTKKTPDHAARGWAHRALAESLLYAGRMGESHAAYVRAERAFERAGRREALAETLVGHIHVLSLRGNHDAVMRTATDARRLLETSGNDVYLAKLAMNLGNHHYQRENAAAALDEYDEAAERFRALGVRDVTTLSLDLNRAVVLAQLDRHEEAVERYAALESTLSESGLELLSAQAAMNRGVAHLLRAEYDDALRATASATGFFRDTDHPFFLGSCLLNRAEVYNQLNRHDLAEREASDAHDLFRRHGVRLDEGLAAHELAVAALGNAHDTLARRHVRAARRIFERERMPARRALTDLIGAELARRGNDHAAALEAARGAWRQFRKLRLPRWQAASAVLCARLCDPHAGRRIQAVLKLLPPKMAPALTFQLLEALGEHEERCDRPSSAARHYRRAATMLERVRVRVPTEETKFAFLTDKSHVFDRLIGLELARRRPSPARLLSLAERAKAQVLEDRMRQPNDDTSASTDASLEAERHHLSWLHTKLSRFELDEPDKHREIGDLRRRLLRAERNWSRRIQAIEESRLPRALAPTPIATVEAVGHRLKRRAAFLSFYAAADHAFAVVVTPARTELVTFDGSFAKDLEAAAGRLDFLWRAAAAASQAPQPTAASGDRRQAGLRRAIDAEFERLGERVWQPVLDRTARDRIEQWFVSPHGAMHRLPIHALRTRGAYAVERGDFVLVPSAGTWLALGARRASRRRAWIAGRATSGLPEIAAELARVRERLNGWDVDVDETPTRGAFVTAGGRVSLLHLAAHGSLRADNPAYSFVELADGPLFAHDVARCRLNGATAVLTACFSGRGIAASGNEWVGMARAFLLAGARNVVGSLWPISDRATAELVSELYEGYADGDPISHALGHTMRQSVTRSATPWEWAAFGTFGAG